MKCSLGISNFLEEISSLPFCCFPLFLCTDCWGRLSYLFLLFFGTLHSDVYIFPFFLCFLLLFFSQLFVRPPQTGIKTIPKKKKCKKSKWLSGEALQIAVKRREVKSKGEKERHKHLNAEFQRIARRDKKAFLSNQCKEIEEKNRMGKTRDLFKN